MAQNSYSTTGGANANAPLNTGNTTTNPTSTTTTSTTGTSTGDKLHEAGTGVKGILAGIHGAGEKIRGEFNGVVDGAFDEIGGVAKNRAVANAADSEIATGQFAHSTKNREGTRPGDGERRL